MNQGAEWLRGRLRELGPDELHSLAVAGGIRATETALCVDGSLGANRAGAVLFGGGTPDVDADMDGRSFCCGDATHTDGQRSI